MEQKKLIIILADISGYTRFMLENQTSAVHGQLIINGLIESILEQVDIPLTLQEIEGDAVFLYAAHPGSEEAWNAVVEEVSRKLGKFFEAFIGQSGMMIEATPCKCAVCRNADQLGLKIIVHFGEAVFHQIAGRAQVSGADVILAHRLLKNSVAAHEYLLLTGQAYATIGGRLPGTFDHHEETYDGFGAVPLRIRFLTDDFIRARDAVYALPESDLKAAAREYAKSAKSRVVFGAVLQQLRNPVRPFTWMEKLQMLLASAVASPLGFFVMPRVVARQLMARAKRRDSRVAG